MSSISTNYSNQVISAETLSEDEEEDGIDVGRKDGPFSALITSMWPHDSAIDLSPPEDESGQVDYRYDEFGFKVEVEDGPEENSSKLLSTPFSEDPKHKLKWLAYLEFSHGDDMATFSINQVKTHLPPSQKLQDMITQEGIPHSLRPIIWSSLSGAATKKEKSELEYHNIVNASSIENLVSSRQIEKDLLRTLPSNACFCSAKSTGVARLRRVLRGIAWLYPDIGYCQGMGVIVASFLLYLEEEDAFWLACTVIEDMLPASYFSSALLGVQADQRILVELIASYLPELSDLLRRYDVEISLISLHWFLTIFAGVIHQRILLRILDLFFYHGSTVIFQVTLGMLKMKANKLLCLDNCSQITNALAELPATIDDVDELIKASTSIAHSLNYGLIQSQRRKHLAYLMADHGAIVNPEQSGRLPKQQLTKRQMKKSSSLFSYLWGDLGADDPKAKNIKQTELLVDLRAAILQIGKHFQSLNPADTSINLNADYTLLSHSLDWDRYIKVVTRRRRRAKALVDFDRHDKDELGFRKNDVIEIISMKDEHCWVGELHGNTGWFPAKFVELLDERTKDYTTAGDDSVSGEITDLVRGTFCSAIKALLEHGLKSSTILGGSTHPWLFIEEACRSEIDKDYQSVYARLVLCRTFRLDEDCKVLTPEELLYKAVQAVNATHDAVHAQMDVKLRSLICCGLNEQALHLWLEALCSSESIVKKWYHQWSFMRSPGWVQIKCDLRVLAQFAFRLSANWEMSVKDKTALNGTPSGKETLNDMLTKHHLFSWNL
ncbi:small G protein signaling modulator 3 homolog isoform X1 [Watersipora subatra]|uniref:small G protein signaling modulator 3 homolog isoform X1 n=1 Tax=Watersipora subatra TaxID=2589382 RepID=UPI00355B8344